MCGRYTLRARPETIAEAFDVPWSPGGFAASYSPGHLSILRMAVRDGGVRCPRCGFDIAQGHDEVPGVGPLRPRQRTDLPR